MIGYRWRGLATHPLLAGAICLCATACGSSAVPTVLPARPPTMTVPPVTTVTTVTTVATTTPTSTLPTIRIGTGSQTGYSVETQAPAGSCSYRAEGSAWLPDPSCTPGAVNPQVTQSTIATTICQSGWTASIRPPASVTRSEKVGSARAYGYTGSFRTGEYDHLIPLELGGAPNDPANLWLQPNDDPYATSTHNSKDGLENTMHGLVCSGRLRLDTAQQAIAANWVAAAHTYQG